MSIKGMIHSIETFGTVDGPGIRYVIFMQGCPLRCQYCHNRDTWNITDGKEMTLNEIIEDIKKYIPFMKSSNGGVTISGGEPTLQLPFITELLKELKSLGIHTCLDTSGYVNSVNINELLEFVDLVLLDLKEINPTKHISITGVSNERILKFARYLSEIGKPMWIRHVVIPGLTDDLIDVIELSKFIQELDTVEKVELLPYHSMGKVKWKKLMLIYPLENIRDAVDSDIKRVSDIMHQYGIKINGSVVA
ncbi:pyruvate formate-lyase-activating protein [Alkaliphilus peptidifermentans]|uniref:Pyruvate formate-lyase-activating enzyme n=1 Tax=Alkaliphilus peptidifermentans DSM 18978 TaxID=1120976 RepID=A0A1G5JVZ5_9FIRM|nr:pyruvate formate-lyase-activating protein [Alkaliphilus peptidifermentans]SCY92344.1 pyruvate formate lyase activating enzyme [Alkaliphilus peptidifermentans DSM 18978]